MGRHYGKIRCLQGLLVLCSLLNSPGFAQESEHVLIIRGLGGMPEYDENFSSWAEKLEKLFREGLEADVLMLDGRSMRREEILQALSRRSENTPGSARVWLVLIGHANHDGEHFKLQIRGPDLTEEDLRSAVDSFGSRRILILASTSASGALLTHLSGENRVLVTATQNAQERQPPLFLSFFLEAAQSAEADTDKNRKISILEAFLYTRRNVSLWYEDRGRLQTEHPVLDDRGRTRLDGDGGEAPNLQTGENLLASVTFLSAPPESSYRSLEARQLAEQRGGIERQILSRKWE